MPSHALFAYLERSEDHAMADLPNQPIMRRWWDYMKDLLRTQPDGAPVVVALTEMFHMS